MRGWIRDQLHCHSNLISVGMSWAVATNEEKYIIASSNFPPLCSVLRTVQLSRKDTSAGEVVGDSWVIASLYWVTKTQPGDGRHAGQGF